MIVALDIGGTKIAAATVLEGRCHDRRQAPMASTAAEFLATIDRLCRDRGTISALTVAVTGYVQGEQIRALNQQTIPFWDHYPLQPQLQKLLACPVMILNDAQAAAWGEYQLRATQCRDLLFITLSTGVGAGLVLDGALRVGQRGLAGHLGHTTVNPSIFQAAALDQKLAALLSVRCGCSRLGCLETLASGSALARLGTHYFGEPLTSAHVCERARAGDTAAQQIVQIVAQAMANAIADCHALYDLDRVVIGGSLGLADGMLGWLQAALSQLPPAFQVPLEAASLGADAGLLGATAWYQQTHHP